MILAIPALLLAAWALAAVAAIPVGALVMLLLGAAHSHEAWIPAPGFAGTYFLTLAVAIASSGTKVNSNSN